MINKIKVFENKKYLIDVCEAGVGDTFLYEGRLYLKCVKDNGKSGDVFILDLKKGRSCNIDRFAQVEVVDCDILVQKGVHKNLYNEDIDKEEVDKYVFGSEN